MALTIKDESVHEAVQQIAIITGESQAQAVAPAVHARLAQPRKDDPATGLMAIGHKTASQMSPETQRLDHGAVLYDDRGLPT
ncbi:type II toxin-antitoxin system VapB family antitoxin [Mycobacterium sp.]|uniref:type II toxin-antitoxin system VapB family antitoxin n=1 Tax=Mycobacterium sp. TaxID=1785 RepID=UPI0031D18715